MSRPDRNWLVLHTVVLLVTLSPLIFVTYVPMLDLPNHIGRAYIISNLSHSPVLQKFYSYNWAFVPNLAFDVFTYFMGKAVGVLLAAKLFCILAATSLYIGTALLHRALHGRYSVVPVAAAVIVYNGAFLFGFVNYVLGVGLSLCAVAAWLRFRELPLKFHAPLFGAIGIGLISVHLYAFGLFGVEVFGFELYRVVTVWRRNGQFPRVEALNSTLAGLAPALLPMVLFFAISPTVSGIGRTEFSSVWWKVEALTEPLIFYLTMAEVLTAVGFVTLFLALLGLRAIAFDARTLVPLTLLFLIFLCVPRTAVSSGYADYRMPAAIALFVLASLDWRPQAARSARIFGSAAILGLAAAKVLMIGQLWFAWQPALSSYATAFAKLPPGSVMLTLEGDSGSTSLSRRPPIVHMQSLATADGVFVPTLYGDEPGYLLRFKSPYLPLKHMAPFARDQKEYFSRYGSYYTHLLIHRPEYVRLPPGLNTHAIASGPTFVLYQLDAAQVSAFAGSLK